MTKSINPDVAAFKDDFFKGLTIRECLYGGGALMAGVGGTLLLYFYFQVNINLAITICMPVIGIIGLCGFYHKNGMTLIEIIKNVVRLMKQKPYTYETRNLFNEEKENQNYGRDKGKQETSSRVGVKKKRY